MYLLDSCVCIDLMRGRLPLAYEILKKSDPSQFAIPSIVVGELFVGAEKSKNPVKNRMLVERFLAPFEVVPFDEGCAAAYGRVRAELESAGTKIGGNDCLIAACAVANNAILVTQNVREFKRVKQLGVESWYEVDL